MSIPRTPPGPDSQHHVELPLAVPPIRHHEPLFDNTSVSAVLSRIGLSSPAVSAFMSVHLSNPPLLAMPSFLRYLRDLVGDSRTAPDPTFTTRMRFHLLLPLDTWDNDLDSETLVTLAIWYKAHDNRLRTFDWERFLDPDAFEIYACTPATEAAALLATPRAADPHRLFGRSAPDLIHPAPTVLHSPPGVPLALVLDSTAVPHAPSQPPPLDLSTYEHNYHDAILASDAADFLRRTTNDSVNCSTLGPRMWRNTTLSPNISDMDRKTFLTTNLHVLDSTDPILINAWYSQLVLQATSANIDLCPLREFDSSQALWPSNNPASHVTEMANVILVKITPLINLRCPALHLLYDSEVTHSDSKLAGYRFLHALLSLADTTIKQSLFAIPLFTTLNDVIQFATDLYQFQQDNARQNRTYTDRQLSFHYLQTLTNADYPLHVQFTQLRDLPLDTPLPSSLHFRTIALALTTQNDTHVSASAGSNSNPPIRRPYLPTAHRLNQTRPMPTNDRTGNPRARPVLADGPFRLREEVQCLACGTWGHQMSRCSQLAKHTLLTSFVNAHSADAERAAASWKTLHSTAPRQPTPISGTSPHSSRRPPAISRRLIMPTIPMPLFNADILEHNFHSDFVPHVESADPDFDSTQYYDDHQPATDFRFPG